MNAQKDPRLARKLAKEQKHLRRQARKNPNALRGKERAICDWDIEFDNYTEPVKIVRNYVEDEDEYADYA